MPQPPEDKVRGKPELFADHYSQARLFWISQTPAEQAHIVNAFRFELTRVQTPAVRVRLLSMLANVDPILVDGVAQGLGVDVPPPMPLAIDTPPAHYEPSPALSLLARPGVTGPKTRKVAILAGHGVEAATLKAVYADLLAAGAAPRVVAPQLGQLAAADGSRIDIEISIDAGPGVLYDAVVIADGAASARMLVDDADAREFVRHQYRHCKPILAIGAGKELLQAVGIPPQRPDGSPDLALWTVEASALGGTLAAFKQALGGHRNFQRENDGLPV
jgi:catalase